MKFHLKHTLGTTAFTKHAKFLFNDSAHLKLQTPKGWHHFEYVTSSNKAIHARLSFHIQRGEARTPVRAPFGSLEIYKNLTQRQIEDFLEQVTKQVVMLGVTKIFIRNYPDRYSEKLNVWQACLLKAGFKQTNDTTSIILVDDKSFESKIKISERQKLRKAASQFTFEHADKTELKKIYSFIDSCRKERNQSLSMSLADLKKLFKTFPDQLFLFKVGTPSTISAAAIVIRVSPKILYTFYYGHAKVHDRISPVVFLISGIYDFAKKNKIKMIDLGTSMVENKLSRSLLHFKKSIGGISDNKSTFTKMLS